MSDSIYQLLQDLPESNLTTGVLHGLDYLVPGEWQNIRSLEEMVKLVTGETDETLIQGVGAKTIELYADSSNGFSRAVTVFKAVDSVGTIAGAITAAHALGSRFESLSFLADHTPKPEVAQAADAGIKFAAELTTFCLTKGIPGDSVGDFVGALGSYGKEDIMRLSAWLAFDVVMPLGPDGLSKIVSAVEGFSEEHLAGNSLFQKIEGFLPGGVAEKKSLILSSLNGSTGFLQQHIDSKGLSQESLFAKAKEWIDIGDKGLDAAAAAIDLLTNYFEHTGIQSVARRCVSRAYAEM